MNSIFSRNVIELLSRKYSFVQLISTSLGDFFTSKAHQRKQSGYAFKRDLFGEPILTSSSFFTTFLPDAQFHQISFPPGIAYSKKTKEFTHRNKLFPIL